MAPLTLSLQLPFLFPGLNLSRPERLKKHASGQQKAFNRKKKKAFIKCNSLYFLYTFPFKKDPFWELFSRSWWGNIVPKRVPKQTERSPYNTLQKTDCPIKKAIVLRVNKFFLGKYFFFEGCYRDLLFFRGSYPFCLVFFF